MSDTHKTRVLLVEPDRDFRELLAALLELSGFLVAVAATGTEALMKAQAALPHAVFLDLVFEDLSGIHLVKQLRALPCSNSMLIVVVSGWTAPSLKQQAIEAGCDDFLLKPVELSVLLQLMAKRSGLALPLV